MKMNKNRLLTIMLAGFSVSVLAVNLLASAMNGGVGVPPNFKAYYDGKLVTMKLTDSSDLAAGAFPTFYVMADAAGNPVEGVVTAIPGEPTYSGRWNAVIMTPADGRNLLANPYTSDDQVAAALAAGKFVILRDGFGFACPILPGN